MTTDTANDRREGYADGMAGKHLSLAQMRARSNEYLEASIDGRQDNTMLRWVYEFRRRAALPEAS